MCVKMIFLTLFCIFGVVHSETHRLHYIYTAFSKPVSQPGLFMFTAMGILDDRPIDTYNSRDQIKTPMQDWMSESNDEAYWQKGTQSRKSKEQWFNVNVNILIDRMQHNKSDLHVLQWMHGCEAEKTDLGKMVYHKGFDQYSYDGNDFLSFNTDSGAWVAPVVQAKPTKLKWDGETILSQYTQGYLKTDCVHWLEKFVKAQEKFDRKLSPPEVHIFSKKSSRPAHRSLVCLATGFYPKDVLVSILKDGLPLGEADGVASSGVRPNGDKVETYQLRKTLEIPDSDTSKYSCTVRHRTLKEPILKSWDGKCCNCDSNNKVIIIAVVVVVVGLIIAASVAVGLLIKRRRANRPLEPQPLGAVAVQVIGQAPQVHETVPLNGAGVNGQGKGSEPSLESVDSGISEAGQPLMPNGRQHTPEDGEASGV